MPKPYIPFGAKYTYEKVRNPKCNPTPYPVSDRLPANAEVARMIRQREEFNMIERSYRAKHELEKQIKFDPSDLSKIELIDTDIIDDKVRTNTFFELRKRFLDLEKDTIKLSAAKREVLFRKMNQLASKGLVDKKQKDTEPEPLFAKTPKERLEEAAKIGRYREYKKKQEEQIQTHKEMVKPITQEEFLNWMVQVTDEKPNRAREEASRLFAMAGKHGIEVQKQDAHEIFFSKNHPEDDDPKERRITILREQDPTKVLWPTSRPITPFPDIKSYDPTHFYDSRPNYYMDHEPNKSSMTNPVYHHQPNGHLRYRHKNQKGRSSSRRVTFSTVNSPSAFGVSSTSMAVQYTGLMRKIQNSNN